MTATAVRRAARILLLAGCWPLLASAESAGEGSLATLAPGEWTLVAIDGEPLPDGAKPPTAAFEGGRIAGFGGCNRYSGPIAEKAPGAIEVGPVASTMMACADAEQVEPRFLPRLGEMTRYAVGGGRLVLSAPDGDAIASLAFERRTPAPPAQPRDP